jgi:ABC-type uncharacterized transport system substrate-binding protein
LPWALRTRIHETTIIDSTGVFWMEFLRRRREFITLLGGAAVAWPLAAQAQQPKPAAKTLASKRAAPALPIVVITGDPVGTKLVESLARPGGNVTGIAILTEMLGVKNLDLLKELLPSATRVAVVWNPDNALWPRVLVALDDAAKTLGVTIQRLEVRRAEDLHGAFSRAVADRANALLFFNDALFTANRAEISDRAIKSLLPAIYGHRAIVAAGGLISYDADFNAMMRRTATYVDKILKGEKPADLPVEQPTRFELVINLKTARTIALTVPPFLLARADEVIE